MEGNELQMCRGLRYLIADRIGNINEPSWQGLYFKDTRHLRELRLLIDNTLPVELTSNNVQFNNSTYVLTNTRSEHIAHNALTIIRKQSLDAGLYDKIEITNNSDHAVSFPLEIFYDTDFADLFEIKHLYLEKGNRPIKRRSILKKVSTKYKSVTFLYVRDDFRRATSILFDKEGSIHPTSARFHVEIPPKKKWHLAVTVRFTLINDPSKVTHEKDFFPEQAFDAAHLIPPNLETDWGDLAKAYDRSLYDLAGLRIRSKVMNGKPANIPAAGLPWFMAVFGRDSLITAYQSLILGSDLLLGVVDMLSEFQGKDINPAKEEEPGKILHEIRFGEVAHFNEWVQFPYYGTIDATPLFLILISEIYRWSGDKVIVENCKENIVKALNWIDTYADIDGDGFYEYMKKTPTGLDNQNWRDSWDSMAFKDGSLAEAPIASADVQGYVYDAKMRTAELARLVWKDIEWARKLEKEAADLKERFNEKFWVPHGEYYALGLDKNKKQIDSLSSSIGHLLWSQIVDEDKIPFIVEQLDNPHLYSGWGVRTLANSSKAYNPIGYHTGTVWPHDNSLIAMGLFNAGFQESAIKIIKDMLQASSYFEYRLPEVFAGFNRSRTPFPVQYPTSSRPQAWSAGTPILFLRILLGIEPDYKNQTLRINPRLPESVDYVRLDGVSAFGKHFLIEATQKRSSIREVKHYTCYICKEIVTEGHTHSSST